MKWFKPRAAFPTVQQLDVTDCGAACLAAVTAHFGLHLPIARIRQLAATDRAGTTLAGLGAAARRLGLSARGVRAPMDGLPNVPLPAIAHVERHDGLLHFVVFVKVTPRGVLLMDPATGTLVERALDATGWTGVLLLVQPDVGFEPGDRRVSASRRFLELIKPHRTILAECVVGAVAYTTLALGTAVFVQKIVDHVLADGNLRLLNLLTLSMITLLIVQAAIGIGRSVLTMRTGQRIDAQLLYGYYRHLLKLPQSFFDTMRVGEVTARFNDAIKIRAFINDAAVDLLVDFLVVAFSLTLLAVYSWQLALVGLALFPVYAIAYAVANQINRRVGRQGMERNAELEAHLVESLGAATTIKRLGLESYARGRFEHKLARVLAPVYTSGVAMLGVGTTIEFANRVFGIGVLFLGARLVLDRALTPGELMSCYALVGQLSTPIASLIGANRTVQDAVIATDRLFEILDLDREADDHGIDATTEPSAHVRMQDVTFGYGARPPVLTGLHVEFPAGQITAVVGESGSGKSTIAALLQRIYDCNRGAVLLGDTDIRHLSLHSLRQVVGVVPQDIHLLAGTLLENIAPGDPDPDMRRIVSLARDLDLLSLVEALPEGFRTPVGERGATLSGGQRQRIAVLRTLYRQPRVLVLDEATAALDARAERFVLDTARRHAAAGGTVVLIAHRLSAAMRADRIVVVHQGKIVETGAHRDLLAAGGAYAALWSEQFGGSANAVHPLMAHVAGREEAAA